MAYAARLLVLRSHIKGHVVDQLLVLVGGTIHAQAARGHRIQTVGYAAYQCFHPFGQTWFPGGVVKGLRRTGDGIGVAYAARLLVLRSHIKGLCMSA